MDHHQHHLNQYRPRPFQGNNNICPICSNSHFPFCPSFDQNPRFPTPQNQPFIRPGVDAYLSPQRPGYVDSRIGVNGFGNYENWSDGDRSRKRVRVGEIVGFGPSGRVGFEEERRLKLIHEHGRASAGDWGLHQRPNHVVHQMPNMAYPVGADSRDWNGNGPDLIRHSQSYGSSGVSVSPVGHGNFPAPQSFASPPSNMQESFSMQGRYPRSHGGMHMVPQIMNQLHHPPPLPLSPPPPIPMEPPRPFPYQQRTSYQLSSVPSSLFPAHLGSSPGAPSPSFPSVLKEHHSATPFLHNRIHFPNSAGHLLQTLPNHYGRMEQPDISKQWTSDKPKVIDAVHLFKQPHRASRPDHFVIILRGLPGSGKSYLAKMLRDIEVENGGEAPRIHSMDEYFMTEVEKPEEYENSKSANSSRGKKTAMKKVMEYCYEPEMEEAYRSSMLKAFKKSLEVGGFAFIIVDDRNLRVAHFAQFWATAKMGKKYHNSHVFLQTSGYEVYLLEAPYKDPAGCAARNVHNFSQDDIEKMAGKWEEASSMYLQLDVKSLSHGDNLKETGIEEVDMDMEDEADTDFPDTQGKATEKTGSSKMHSSNDEKQEDDDEVVTDQSFDAAKELGRSKWSNDEDEEDVLLKYNGKRNNNDLSGSVKAYGKKIKSIRWGDQVKDTGFSIGAAKKATQSLVIGPGPGYNLTTNPVQGDGVISSVYKSGNNKTAFQERLRAEHESFKDVFAKRKQRLGFVLQDE